MSNQQLKRLGLLLAGLVVIWLGLSFYRRSTADRVETFKLAKLDRAKVDAIEIDRPADTLRIARQGSGWTVNGLPAAADLVTGLLDQLTDTSSTGELVAESKASHARLGVDSLKAKTLVVRGGGAALVTYLVGNRGSTWEAVYLRRPGEERVYQVKGRLAEAVERPVDDWRDKVILAIEPDSVDGIEVTRGKGHYTLARSGKVWTIDGVPADSLAAATLVSQLKKLEASGFATAGQVDSANFTTPDRIVKVMGKGGRAVASLAFDSTATSFLVKRDSLATVYRLESYTVNQLAPADSTLKAKAAAPATPAKPKSK